MKTRVMRMGKYHGIRIPKPLREQTGLRGAVEINAQDDSLVIRPARLARDGWSAAFQAMARRGDDALLDDAGRLGGATAAAALDLLPEIFEP
jgi:antitoxin MazE